MPNPHPGDQASVFISPRGRVATHFSRLLRHAWVTPRSPHGDIVQYHTVYIYGLSSIFTITDI
jgi:hypothetical protein